MKVACPCCGYRTLPSHGDYEVCPVCGWEDDGMPPWNPVGPNGSSLVEAQMAFLAEGPVRRRLRQRRRYRRAPRPDEARDRDWRPLDAREELLARAREELRAEHERSAAMEALNELRARFEPDPVQEFNAGWRALRDEARSLSYPEVEQRFRTLSRDHGFRFPDAEFELLARETHDEHWRRRHPLQLLSWCWRHRRTARRRTRLRQALTGTIRFVG